MYENKNQKLISKLQFRSRVWNNVKLFFLLLIGFLSVGVLGYHFLGELDWVDSFVEACMILGGMGPVNTPLRTTGVKIFAGIYAIFSGVAFLSGVTLLISPFWHRELHRFHLADEESEEDDDKKKVTKKKK